MTARTSRNAKAAEQLRKTSTAQATASDDAAKLRAEAADTENLFNKARASVEDLLNGLRMPSWTRRLVSTLASLTVAASVAYGCLGLIDVLALATALYTGSQFMTFLVVFIGFALTMMSMVTAATKVFEFCMEFEYSNVKARVSNWFGGFKTARA